MFTLTTRTYMYVQPYGASRKLFFHDSTWILLWKQL